MDANWTANAIAAASLVVATLAFIRSGAKRPHWEIENLKWTSASTLDSIGFDLVNTGGGPGHLVGVTYGSQGSSVTHGAIQQWDIMQRNDYAFKVSQPVVMRIEYKAEGLPRHGSKVFRFDKQGVRSGWLRIRVHPRETYLAGERTSYVTDPSKSPPIQIF